MLLKSSPSLGNFRRKAVCSRPFYRIYVDTVGKADSLGGTWPEKE